jgi:4-amino-4-deoxy-L-arabinose transferase-like glycosyltransferase
MKTTGISEKIWGKQAYARYLFLATILMLFAFLGSRELWTQEHRWADIVSGMFYRHDFLHPYLGQATYYDKPLLSYWLMAGFAKLFGSLSTWALRMPSALAGLLGIWSVYRIGSKIQSRELGLLSGWMLITTFYFVFWARVSSADMLNLGGSMIAIAWYLEHRDAPRFFSCAVFFIIVALTSLCKGLVGALVPFIAVMVDISLRKTWLQYFRLSLFLSILPGLIIYFLPFLASSYFNPENYSQSGLYLVYRENIMRYFQPFDHKGSVFTYFIYLPIYMLPWVIFLFPAIFTLFKRYRSLSLDSKWLVWTFFVIFIFFTLSGSRRSYYVLPIVPFATLLTADWLLNSPTMAKYRGLITAIIVSAYLAIFLTIDVIPAWYNVHYGVEQFARAVKEEAEKIQPWDKWKLITLDAQTKVNFYFNLPPNAEAYFINGSKRKVQTSESLRVAWPILAHKPANVIFITRRLYAPALAPYFDQYQRVDLWEAGHPHWLPGDDNAPVAFIPLSGQKQL